MELKHVEQIKALLSPHEDIQRLAQRDAGVQAAIEAAIRHEGLTARIGPDFLAEQGKRPAEAS
ncbi:MULTISPECIES: hypothetical protein [Acidovorax]|uniref:Uncharacterized protein n=1 Tax=Acidovorax facilis TaxID=12917 RepID=A0ABV8DGZ2_9BURK|nr:MULTISPECIES: hypothetical protein [Acidovorax]KQB57125.1 hypothetical protein AE621_22450 [Acidovorax sp. SD340]MCO4245685.1 hypothetical protein [Acidovorax facilis]